MIPSAESRTGILAVFLLLQMVIFALEVLVFIPSIKKRGWYMPLRQWLAPIGTALFGVVLAPIVFRGVRPTGKAACLVDLDADVAGDGVRIAAWMQVCVLIAISFLGTFHPRATGAKEMGAGLVLTHASLAIALVVQVRQGALTLADAAVACMILDAQNMALSMPLAAKEALAARWQVLVMAVVQLFGLIVLLFITKKLLQGSFATKDCPCLTVFWWAWLSNCRPPQKEQALFWVYCSLRCLIFVQAMFHALYNTWKFHEAEPKCGSEGTEIQQKGGVLVQITYPNNNSDGIAAAYSEYPATSSFMYALHGVLALTSLSAAEMAIRHSDLEPSSAINSVGQIIALVVAGATVLRAAWLFLKLFISDWRAGKISRIMLPFRLYKFTRSSQWEGYTLLPTFDLAPDAIKLGTVVVDPKHPSIPLDDPVAPEASRSRVKENYQETATTIVPAIKALFDCIPAFRNVAAEGLGHIKADKIETVKFWPTEEYIEESMKKPGVADYLKSMRGPANRVFMVTGVMAAESFTISRELSVSFSIPMSVFTAGAGGGVGISRTIKRSTTGPGLRCVAYQLEAITVGRDGSVFEAQRYKGDFAWETAL